MSDCPPIDSWESLLTGVLPAPEAAGLAAHLAACFCCQEKLDELTEHPDLRLWAREARSRTARPIEPGLLTALQSLRAASETELPESNTPHSLTSRNYSRSSEPDLTILHLGPPFARDELGTLDLFRLQTVLGWGGMGVVFRAWDPVLARSVAIKLLRPERADADARRRLVREAQFAARLRHNHIVTVHAVVDPPAGLPYLVMELLEGPSLEAFIRAHRVLKPDQAAELVSQAADALAAAHALGLIHRDIKPANMLLQMATSSGRVNRQDSLGPVQSAILKITDFGLARPQETTGLTMEEIGAGTPEYMSPEQIIQETPLDGRVDVYGLGATLYEALTGQPPFRGSPHGIVQQILHDEPLPIRRLNDRVPRDLETVCIKALAKEPRRRYSSPQDLADDLNRWRRGEPIRARQVGRVERCWRWCRRNPRTALLSASLAATLMLGVIGILWQWLRAESNLREVSRQHSLALHGFEQARDAVDRFYTQVSENRLLLAPGLEPLRKELLQSARTFYEQFVREHRQDPAMRWNLAQTLTRLAKIEVGIDGSRDALALLQQAIVLERQLLLDQPSHPEARTGLVETLKDLGNRYLEFGEIGNAEAAYQEALSLTGQLPNEPGARALCARLQNNLGIVYLRRQEFVRAEAAYQSAVDRHAWLAQHQSNIPDHQANLAQSCMNLGECYVWHAQTERARALYDRALSIWKGLSTQPLHPATLQVGLGICRVHLGVLDYMTATKKSMAQELDDGLDDLRRAVALSPSLMENQWELARACALAGRVHQGLGQRERALAAFREGNGLLEDLYRRGPSVPQFAIDLAISYVNWGTLDADFGHSETALAKFSRGIEMQEGLLKKQPEFTLLGQSVARAHVDRALALFQLDRRKEALADVQKAQEESRAPGLAVYRLAQHVLTNSVSPGAADDEIQKIYGSAAENLEAVLLAPAPSRSESILAAQILDLCVQAARLDQCLTPRERNGLIQDYQERARICHERIGKAGGGK